jgi:assimilatory nitrate reductase catalytic subunit
LPVRTGTDVMLFNGLLCWLTQRELIDRDFLEQHTRGAAQTLAVAENTAGDIDTVARACGVRRETLLKFYEWFGAAERVVSAFSQGVNQSSSGTDKANSIINVHLLTGRLGRPGMGPFSITGQPNAMGGREVGGLANMLAAHMDLENPQHRRIVQEFWRSPTMAQRPGLKAVDMFEAVHRGQIKALWIIGTNPVVSMPNANRTREALRRCEFVAISDCIANTDTTALAQVLLPAAAWGEKNGSVTNSDRHISRQRSFMEPAGESRPDWWMICQVAQRLGFEQGFAFTSAAEIFDEHARLSMAGNAGTRAFDIGGLAGLGEAGYAELEPIPWPVRAAPVLAAQPAASSPPAQPRGTRRLFADSRFYHPDGRARLVPTRPRPPLHALDDEYPLLLNTGRIRDQWHTMTRSGRSPRLSSHLPEPFVDMHPADALRFGLGEGGLVRVETRWGHLVARLRCSGEISRGSLFVPIHWNATTASDARVGALVSPAVDPVSGEPEFKCTPARVEAFVVSWYGFALSRERLRTQDLTWWVSGAGVQHFRYEIAGRRVPGNWPAWARTLLAADPSQDWLDYTDAAAGTYRAAYLRDEQLQTCLFIGRRPELPSRSWLASLFQKPRLSPAERANLLSGKPADPAADGGALVCACFGVGRNAIEAAIGKGCKDARAIGKQLKAGTNCGSCVPELNRLLAASIAAA